MMMPKKRESSGIVTLYLAVYPGEILAASSSWLKRALDGKIPLLITGFLGLIRLSLDGEASGPGAMGERVMLDQAL
jgi:hypothetical protein